MGKQWGPSIVLTCISGLLIAGFGIYFWDGSSKSWFLIGFGFLLVVTGVMSAVQQKRMSPE